MVGNLELGTWNLELGTWKQWQEKAKGIRQSEVFVGFQLLKALFAVCRTRLQIRDFNSRRANERRGLALGVQRCPKACQWGRPDGLKVSQATAS
jgi:hypothetical protein